MNNTFHLIVLCHAHSAHEKTKLRDTTKESQIFLQSKDKRNIDEFDRTELI